VAAPVGPTGCATNPEQARLPFAIGFGYGFSDTKLILATDGSRYRFQQSAYTASFIGTLESGTVLGAAVGPHMGGQADGVRKSTEHYVIRPGVVWALTIGRRFFGSKPTMPYLLVVGTFSGSSTSIRRESDGELAGLHAFDAKADVSMGWTLGEAFSPYAAVRAFGGPVLWEQDGKYRLAGDLYHVSLACGFNLSIGHRVSAYFDGAFLGARGLSGGFAVRF
jgi:hypothetical protein